MNRKLKALGLSLIAAFAMSAVSAGAASAEIPGHFEVDASVNSYTGEAISPQVFSTSPEESVTCNEVEIVSGSIENSEGEEVTKGSQAMVAPAYSGSETYGENACEINLGEETLRGFVDFTTNECTYTFTATTGETTENETHADVHLECGGSGVAYIKATAFKLGCYEIPSQTIKHAVHYTNNEPGGVKDVTVEATAENIKFTKVGVCGSGTFETASYDGDVTVKATNGAGEPVDLSKVET